MAQVKRICLIAGFFMAMLFAFAQNTNAVNKAVPEKPHSFSPDKAIHGKLFLQPEPALHFVGNSKPDQQPVSKYILDIPEMLSEIALLPVLPLFHFQDIDRCEKVSLLLFPYHFFW